MAFFDWSLFKSTGDVPRYVLSFIILIYFSHQLQKLYLNTLTPFSSKSLSQSVLCEILRSGLSIQQETQQEVSPSSETPCPFPERVNRVLSSVQVSNAPRSKRFTVRCLYFLLSYSYSWYWGVCKHAGKKVKAGQCLKSAFFDTNINEREVIGQLTFVSPCLGPDFVGEKKSTKHSSSCALFSHVRPSSSIGRNSWLRMKWTEMRGILQTSQGRNPSSEFGPEDKYNSFRCRESRQLDWVMACAFDRCYVIT